MHPLLNIALTAARAAGEHISRQIHFGKVKIDQKTSYDFVTDVDRAAERIVIDTIQKHYPEHRILGEESGSLGNPESDIEWIIDPIDGTTNFIYGIPQFCVSIGIAEKGSVMHGVVLDPMKNEEFTASRGAGAQLNQKRIRVSKQPNMTGALIGTGIPFGTHYSDEQLTQYLDTLKAFLPETAGIRRLGASALDLAYVACGRLDGFWEMNLKPWDIAAGSLLVQEAGGLIGDFSAEMNFLKNGQIIAANPKLFKPICQILQPKAAVLR